MKTISIVNATQIYNMICCIASKYSKQTISLAKVLDELEGIKIKYNVTLDLETLKDELKNFNAVNISHCVKRYN